MKTITAIATLLLFSLVLNGQQLSRSTLSSAGDFSKNEKGLSIDWTMGAIFSQSVEESHHITEGFQQGRLTPRLQVPVGESFQTASYHSIDEETKVSEERIAISIFPNPTAHSLFLKLNAAPSTTFVAKVMNANGMTVIHQKINSIDESKLEIDGIADLTSGVYFISLYDEHTFVQSKRFLKL